MRLLIVRHGLAGDREQFAATGQPDELRPLTDEGVREFAKFAGALHRLVDRIDLLATSPLVRARQTAAILAEEFEVSITETSALRPDASFTEFFRWAAHGAIGETNAIVGHEPHLSGLVARLIGSGDASVDLKKGGACLVEFDGALQDGAGTLSWLVQPGVARKLRRDQAG